MPALLSLCHRGHRNLTTTRPGCSRSKYPQWGHPTPVFRTRRRWRSKSRSSAGSVGLLIAGRGSKMTEGCRRGVGSDHRGLAIAGSHAVVVRGAWRHRPGLAGRRRERRHGVGPRQERAVAQPAVRRREPRSDANEQAVYDSSDPAAPFRLYGGDARAERSESSAAEHVWLRDARRAGGIVGLAGPPDPAPTLSVRRGCGKRIGVSTREVLDREGDERQMENGDTIVSVALPAGHPSASPPYSRSMVPESGRRAALSLFSRIPVCPVIGIGSRSSPHPDPDLPVVTTPPSCTAGIATGSCYTTDVVS